VIVGGKTGTAEVPDPAGGYKDDESIGSFVGFVSGRDPGGPELVVMVRVSGAGRELGGWEHAAIGFAEIVNFMVKYYGIGG